MKSNKWRKIAFILAMIGVTQYVLLCTVAMIFYPGGTEIDSTRSGYSFFTNIMSDLGRIQSLSGEPNLMSMILFITAVITVNLFFIPFYMAMTYFFSEKRIEKLFCHLAATSGIISALFGMGIAFLPVDQFPTAHLSVTITFCFFFVIALCLFTVPILSNNSYPNRYGYIIISYAVILAIYTIMVLIGLDLSMEQRLLIFATGQKITIYSGFFCVFILAFGAFKRYNNLNQDIFSLGSSNS